MFPVKLPQNIIDTIKSLRESKDFLVSGEKITELKAKMEKEREKAILKMKRKQINDWKKGKTNYLNGIKTIYLRVKDDIVHTSLGAEVSLKQAIVMYKRILSGKPVHGFKFDYYTVTGYNDNILTIGCHQIERSELDRIAKELKII